MNVAVKQADGTTKEIARYPDYPPLLFPPDKIGNMAYIFLNPMLITVSSFQIGLVISLKYRLTGYQIDCSRRYLWPVDADWRQKCTSRRRSIRT